MNAMSSHICPVCGNRLDFAPWDGESASDEICPCCGTQFGYDDCHARPLVYRALREQWISDGMRWWSTSRPAPPGWDPAAQLRRVETRCKAAAAGLTTK